MGHLNISQGTEVGRGGGLISKNLSSKVQILGRLPVSDIDTWLPNNFQQISFSTRPYHSCVHSCQAFDFEWGWRGPCCDRDQNLVNPLTLKSDYHLISPYNITTESHINVMRLWKLLIVQKILLVSILVNVQRTVWRIWLLMLGCKGLTQ